MSLLFLAVVFFLGSGFGQYLIKQLSINVSSGIYFSANNILAVIFLLFTLGVCQAFYLYVLRGVGVSVAYPVTIGSSFLGVMLMSLIVLNEQPRPSVLLGSMLILAGLVIAKG